MTSLEQIASVIADFDRLEKDKDCNIYAIRHNGEHGSKTRILVDVRPDLMTYSIPVGYTHKKVYQLGGCE